jgi:NADPH2 dehydrogenase
VQSPKTQELRNLTPRQYDRTVSPTKVGALALQHWIVMAPLARYRADEHNVPLPIVKVYYKQRASTPGSMIITEGTFISRQAGGFVNVPGIWNDKQIEAWREITDAVHENGSFIVCQLWAIGRAARTEILTCTGYKVTSASDIPIDSKSSQPTALTEEGIQSFINDYATAAKNAIAAGFDAVEIHGANGYLCDQFLQDVSNNRTDLWGGSVENRARFGVEMAKAVVAAIGADRTGYRVSPWSPLQAMRMADPIPQFSYLAEQLGDLNLAYLHVVQSRISVADDVEVEAESVEFLLDIWKSGPGIAILAGSFTPESGAAAAEKYQDVPVAIAFGRSFLANPDLPYRIEHAISLNKYNRATFSTPQDPVGYIDYPFSKLEPVEA